MKVYFLMPCRKFFLEHYFEWKILGVKYSFWPCILFPKFLTKLVTATVMLESKLAKRMNSWKTSFPQQNGWFHIPMNYFFKPVKPSLSQNKYAKGRRRKRATLVRVKMRFQIPWMRLELSHFMYQDLGYRCRTWKYFFKVILEQTNFNLEMVCILE